MYKAVPHIYGSLFDIINDEFGTEGRGYIATFEKECMPRRGSDLIPKLFPWAYLTISKLGRRLTEGTFYRNGRQAWYQATLSVVIIGMSKDGDIARLIANPDFDGDPKASGTGTGKHRGRVDALYVCLPPNAGISWTRRIVRSPDGTRTGLRSETIRLSVKPHRRRNTTIWRNTSAHGKSILTSTS